MICQLGFVDIDQRAVMDEKILGRSLPTQCAALVVYLHSTARDDEVHVRMVDHRITAPGMQHSEVPQLATTQCACG